MQTPTKELGADCFFNLDQLYIMRDALKQQLENACQCEVHLPEYLDLLNGLEYICEKLQVEVDSEIRLRGEA